MNSPQDASRPMSSTERESVAQGDRHMARMSLQRADTEACARGGSDHEKVAGHIEVARGYLELAALEWPEPTERTR